jgi:predicted membrane channel-forming protein YqfA (hemolysin III family)
MLKDAHLSFLRMKKNIFLFGIINAAVFIGLFFAFKYLNLRNITGLRIINYVVLAIISIIQIHKLIKDNKGYIPFLQAYFISFFTGTF